MIEKTPQVHMRPVDGTPTIARIDLHTEGEVPGLDEAEFRQLATPTKEICAVSRAPAGVAHIDVSATLVGAPPG